MLLRIFFDCLIVLFVLCSVLWFCLMVFCCFCKFCRMFMFKFFVFSSDRWLFLMRSFVRVNCLVVFIVCLDIFLFDVFVVFLCLVVFNNLFCVFVFVVLVFVFRAFRFSFVNSFL